jgi:hypothetical protein
LPRPAIGIESTVSRGARGHSLMLKLLERMVRRTYVVLRHRRALVRLLRISATVIIWGLRLLLLLLAIKMQLGG